MNLIPKIRFALLGFVILIRMPSCDSFNTTALALQQRQLPSIFEPFLPDRLKRCADFFGPIWPWETWPYDSIGPQEENSVPSTALSASQPPRLDFTVIDGSRKDPEVEEWLDLEMPCQADKKKGDKECKEKYGWYYVCRNYGDLYGQSDRWYCDCHCYRYHHEFVMLKETCSCPLRHVGQPDRRYQARVKEGKGQLECKLREGEICVLKLEHSEHAPQCSTGPPFWPVRLTCKPIKWPNGTQSDYGFCVRSSANWHCGESIFVFSMLYISLSIVFNQFGML